VADRLAIVVGAFVLSSALAGLLGGEPGIACLRRSACDRVGLRAADALSAVVAHAASVTPSAAARGGARNGRCTRQSCRVSSERCARAHRDSSRQSAARSSALGRDRQSGTDVPAQEGEGQGMQAFSRAAGPPAPARAVALARAGRRGQPVTLAHGSRCPLDGHGRRSGSPALRHDRCNFRSSTACREDCRGSSTTVLTFESRSASSPARLMGSERATHRGSLSCRDFRARPATGRSSTTSP